MSHQIACFFCEVRHKAYDIGSRWVEAKGHALFARLVELYKLRDIVRCDRERERLRRRHQQVDQDPGKFGHQERISDRFAEGRSRCSKKGRLT